MYDPQLSDDMDFEGFFDTLKKGVKKVGDVAGKVTDLTITKPSAFIGKMVGGKKGEAIGRKLGGFTSKVTNFGIKAGAVGAAAPLLASPTALTAAGAGFVGKKLFGRKRSKSRKPPTIKTSRPGWSPSNRSSARISAKKPASCSADNALAAKVGAMLVSKLGGPLGEANKALRLAELQRTATYEHRKLMGDAEFRKKVLAGITAAANGGNSECQKTIRVIVGR